MVTVYYTDVTESDIDFYKYISNYKKAVLDKYKQEKQKKLSAYCEMLLYNALGDVKICYHKQHKPFLTDNKYHFNFSHSGDISVCAVSDNEVGVDVEKIRVVNFLISERFFTAQENNAIMSSKDIKKEFFNYWTLKESYLKYLGTGLNKPLNSFEVLINKKITIYDEYVLKNVNFFQEKLSDYVISVCSNSEKCDFKYVKF